MGNASFDVLWGCRYDTDEHGIHYINNNSLVTKVTCGSVRYLTCGDIEDITEKQILDAGIDVSADIYKMSHHGGNTSNTQEFIKKVNPVFAFYCSGSDGFTIFNPSNSWTHTPVANMAKISDVYSAKYNGEVDFVVNNGLIKTSCERNYVTREVTFQDKLTGKITTVTYKFNKAGNQYIPDRLYTLSGSVRPFGTKENGFHWYVYPELFATGE